MRGDDLRHGLVQVTSALIVSLGTGQVDAAAAEIRFVDVAEKAGLDFVLEHGPTPSKHLIEAMPGGVAAFDADGDGRTDIYFANGASVPGLEKLFPSQWNRLFRNQGGMRFEDVTERAGLAGAGYCIGAAAADYDNDGDTDLFVAGVDRNFLYRNDGKGRFEDVSRSAGIRSGLWSVGGVWLDYDVDGLLDLFVVNYLQWSAEFDVYCGDPLADVRSYCDPGLFDGLSNHLYRNLGDGTFEDVSESSGVARHVGKGMAGASADYDFDGYPDIFVANDKMPNFLYRNVGDGTFEETALLAGVALQDHGMAVSGMGVDFRDYDNDGRPDLLFTALAGESYPLFRNTGSGVFRDVTFSSGMSAMSFNRSGWSIGLVDFDNDGWKDVFAANSHVNDTVEHFQATQYRLANSIHANRGDGTFLDVRGAGLDAVRAHRGAAFADFNEDGRMDAVVTALGERAELWENVSVGTGNWIAFDLVGSESNRAGIGAQVRIAGQVNEMTTSVGYASSRHGAVHFGLGAAETVPRVQVRWPSGTVQDLSGILANRVLRVVEPDRSGRSRAP